MEKGHVILNNAALPVYRRGFSVCEGKKLKVRNKLKHQSHKRRAAGHTDRLTWKVIDKVNSYSETVLPADEPHLL